VFLCQFVHLATLRVPTRIGSRGNCEQYDRDACKMLTAEHQQLRTTQSTPSHPTLHNKLQSFMIFHLRNAFVLLSAAAAVSTAAYAGEDGSVPPRAHELDKSYTFERYLAHFNKSYDDPDEYARRSRIFARNLNTILSHNGEKKMNEDGDIIGGGFVMGVNAFTDVDAAELPMGYQKFGHAAWSSQRVGAGGLKMERLLGETQSYSKPPDFEMDDVSALPAEVDWEEEGKVNPTIPQQGGCGSCWSFAATAVIESHLAIATGEDPVSLSEQNVLQCTPNPDQCGGKGDCSGATVELALNYVADLTAKKQGGMFRIEDVPYHGSSKTWVKCDEVTSGKTPMVGIEGWTKLPDNNYKATMNAVAKVGPLAIAVSANNWSFYEKGIFENKDDDAVVNHAVLLVGYGVDDCTGEKYYKVRNSWGPGFGEGGYIRIKRTDDDQDLCKMDDQPLIGVDCALDDNGNKVFVKPVKVCGTSGALFDVSYPIGVHYLHTSHRVDQRVTSPAPDQEFD
ncbi:hypothetical protein ACHAW5_004349, partial [Stephanodiscus triporus]